MSSDREFLQEKGALIQENIVPGAASRSGENIMQSMSFGVGQGKTRVIL